MSYSGCFAVGMNEPTPALQSRKNHLHLAIREVPIWLTQVEALVWPHFRIAEVGETSSLAWALPLCVAHFGSPHPQLP